MRGCTMWRGLNVTAVLSIFSLSHTCVTSVRAVCLYVRIQNLVYSSTLSITARCNNYAILAMILLRLCYVLLLAIIMGWTCYDGCPSGSKGFPTEKGLQRHQNSCPFAQQGFASAIAASKRKLAAEKEEAAIKALANEQAEAERQRLRELEAEASFLPVDSTPQVCARATYTVILNVNLSSRENQALHPFLLAASLVFVNLQGFFQVLCRMVFYLSHSVHLFLSHCLHPLSPYKTLDFLLLNRFAPPLRHHCQHTPLLPSTALVSFEHT